MNELPGDYMAFPDPCRHVSRLDIIRHRLRDDWEWVDGALAHAEACRRAEEVEG